MRKLALLISFIIVAASGFSQDFEFKEDKRPSSKKEDIHNQYQANIISKYEMLKALEIAGVKIHKVLLNPFDKKYNLEVYMHEYVNGKIEKSETIFAGDNSYIFFYDTKNEEDIIPYYNYLDQLTFYFRQYEDKVTLHFETYAMTCRKELTLRKERDRQFYNWRAWTKTNWRLNEEVPLITLASSWFDEQYNVERFCGIVDLSMKAEDTQELLDSSPHYYIITYKISE